LLSDAADVPAGSGQIAADLG